MTNICECINPIPQATLSHVCQNCYKTLKEYTMKVIFIVISDDNVFEKDDDSYCPVIETTVTVPLTDTVYDAYLIALKQTGNKPVKENKIFCTYISLDSNVSKIEAELLLKKEKNQWILAKA